MPESDDKWIVAVSKLIRLTQEGEIKWQSQSPPDHLKGDEDDYVHIVFVTTYNGRRLRLYRNDYKIQSPLAYMQKWDYVINLEIIDTHGNAMWSFPRVEPINDLFSTVSYHVADVKGLLDDLIDSTPPAATKGDTSG